MARKPRVSLGNICYHVLNRGNGRKTVFHKDGDYAAFLKLMKQASERIPMRLLSYCLLPNHFHLALWPENDGDLSKWMQWLTTAHVRRYHRHYDSSGHVGPRLARTIQVVPNSIRQPFIDRHAVRRRKDWLDWVNRPLNETERDALRMCIARGQPFGEEKWKLRTAKKLGIESSLRPRGRPRKKSK